MRIMKLLLIFLVGIMIAGCHSKLINNYYDFRLKVNNKSGKEIVAFYDYNYPDTSLPSEAPKSIDGNNWRSAPGGSITLDRGGSWEVAFTEQIPSGKLIIYVLDGHAFDTISWNDLRNDPSYVLRRFDVSLADLNNVNFVLSVQ